MCAFFSSQVLAKIRLCECVHVCVCIVSRLFVCHTAHLLIHPSIHFYTRAQPFINDTLFVTHAALRLWCVCVHGNIDLCLLFPSVVSAMRELCVRVVCVCVRACRCLNLLQ
eukprot:GDKK01042976.1.p2 GENE.GDKK01042976.1~~GDKK01042976.1.p2  ORF type:complete len:111 (+),score=2.15 GDKK01042976.1:292-624(+)